MIDKAMFAKIILKFRIGKNLRGIDDRAKINKKSLQPCDYRDLILRISSDYLFKA